MIKFSISHSSILAKAGEFLYEEAHKLHIDKIARLIEAAGAEIIEKTRVNVTALIEETHLREIFDFAEDAIEGFYGKITARNGVLGHLIDHFEHHGHHGNGGS